MHRAAAGSDNTLELLCSIRFLCFMSYYKTAVYVSYMKCAANYNLFKYIICTLF